jgi:hypothetical protein
MNATGTILLFVLVLSWAYGRGIITGRGIVWICTSLLVISFVFAAFHPPSITGMPPGFYPPGDPRDHEYRGERINITNVRIIAGAFVAYALLTALQTNSASP